MGMENRFLFTAVLLVLSLPLCQMPAGEGEIGKAAAAAAAALGETGTETETATATDSRLYCTKGEYLSPGDRETKQERCLPCPDRTYMSDERHRRESCLPCKRPKSSRLIVEKKCTPVSNSVLGCPSGKYKHYNHATAHAPDDFTCVNCLDCSQEQPAMYQGRPCKGSENTVCCDRPGMDVVAGECVPPKSPPDVRQCPHGQYYSDRTPRPVLGFQSQTSTTSSSSSSCVPCTQCSSSPTRPHQVRACGPETDTVCCPYEGMEASDPDPKTGRYQCRCATYQPGPSWPTPSPSPSPCPCPDPKKGGDHDHDPDDHSVPPATADTTGGPNPARQQACGRYDVNLDLLAGAMIFATVVLLFSALLFCLATVHCYYYNLSPKCCRSGDDCFQRVQYGPPGRSRTPSQSDSHRRKNSLLTTSHTKKNSAYESDTSDNSHN